MGNSQTLSCTSGEKSTKAQRKEEQYTKTAPTDKVKENGDENKPVANGDAETHETAAASSAEPKVDAHAGGDESESAAVTNEQVKTDASDEKTDEEPAKPVEPTTAAETSAVAEAKDVELKVEEASDKPTAEAEDSTVADVEPVSTPDDKPAEESKPEEPKESSTHAEDVKENGDEKAGVAESAAVEKCEEVKVKPSQSETESPVKADE